MADLDSDVAGRMLLGDHGVHGSVADLCEYGRFAVDAHVDLRYPGHCGDARLDSLEFILEGVFAVGSKRSGRECGYENCLGRHGRIGDDSVRPLNDGWPQTALEKGSLDFSGSKSGRILGAEVHGLSFSVGFYQDREQFPLLTPGDFLHGSADRRREEDVRVLLVCQNWRSCENLVPFLYEKSRGKTFEVRRLHGYNVRHDLFLCFEGCFSAYRNVQTLFQIDFV